MKNDRAYFEKRAAEERAAAALAQGKAREAHVEMAQRYADLAGYMLKSEEAAAKAEPADAKSPAEPAIPVQHQ